MITRKGLQPIPASVNTKNRLQYGKTFIEFDKGIKISVSKNKRP